MEHLKKSLLLKILLLILSFSCGMISAYESYQILTYYDNYSPDCDSLEKTWDFSELYLVYLQRACVYVKYREAGYTENPSSIYTSSDLISILSGDATGNLRPSDSVYQLSQDSFEYYNCILNKECHSFYYYIKNMQTGDIYYSPGFQTIVPKGTQITADWMDKYMKDITKKDAYLILSTNNSLYSTNMTTDNYRSANSSGISWCINYLNQNTRSVLSTQTSVVTPDQYMIYTFFDASLPNEADEFTNIASDFNTLRYKFDQAVIVCPVGLLLCLFFALIFLVCCGNKKNYDGIYLNAFDRWYSELSLFLLCLIPICFYGIFQIKDIFFIRFDCTRYLILYTMCYLFLALFITTIVKRIKANTLISNSLIAHCAKKIKVFMGNCESALSVSSSITLRIFATILLFLLEEILCFFMFHSHTTLYLFINCILLLVFMLTNIKFYLDITKVINSTKNIMHGDLDTKIDIKPLSAPVNQLANDINNIRAGLSTAVEEQIKSERLKTELITNVSHDIKTPLTSIINYVDLLDNPKLTEEKRTDYLHILKDKSWRLKVLIEDLVEASKASVGAVTLNLEKLNFVELIRQSLGEYEDRLELHHLEPVLNIECDPLYIYADGRSTFRIIENLLSNVCKYALEHTRIYVTLTTKETFIQLEIKNISARKLGLDSSELIERFVRGDISRNTEGSGLGLSIANSLTTLQKGTFELKVDGDLFKAIVNLEQWKEPSTQGISKEQLL